jgi:Rrf2 family protein
MLKMNKKLEYGVMALIHLGGEKEKVSSVKENAQSYHIPENILSKVMQSLKNVGLVSPVHGNHGGYRLTKELSQINLLEINNAVVGPVQIADCLGPKNGDCPAKSACSIISPIDKLNEKIIHLFESTNIEHLFVRQNNL